MDEKTVIPAYQRNVKYYETDRMQIVHHSNYIRWFEEARIDFFGKIGTPFHIMEAEGFVAPVLSVSCEYKSMTRFGEDVYVLLKLEECSGVRFAFSYRVIDKESGQLRCTGRSDHCFIDESGRPINFKRKGPKYYELFSSLLGVETQIV